MADTPNTTPETPAPTAAPVEKGAQLGQYLVAAGALKQEQVKDLLDVQKIVKGKGTAADVPADRAQALNATYGALITESINAPKPRYLGELAVASGMVQSNLGVDAQKATAVVETMAALQANHRLEMVASVLSDQGVNKDALVAMRSRGIFPIDINSLPEEHWIDNAPEQVKRMQSQASMAKLMMGNMIQGSPEIAKSPEVQNAVTATKKLAYANNQELAGRFNELGLPTMAGMVTSGTESGVVQGSLVATTPADDNKTLNATLTQGVVDSSNKLQLEMMAAIQRRSEKLGEWTLKRAGDAGLGEAELKTMSDNQITATKAMIEVATADARHQPQQPADMGSFAARFGNRSSGQSNSPRQGM